MKKKKKKKKKKNRKKNTLKTTNTLKHKINRYILKKIRLVSLCIVRTCRIHQLHVTNQVQEHLRNNLAKVQLLKRRNTTKLSTLQVTGYKDLSLILSSATSVQAVNRDTDHCTDKYHCSNYPGDTPSRPIIPTASAENMTLTCLHMQYTANITTVKLPFSDRFSYFC